jgi:hypothetical protein
LKRSGCILFLLCSSGIRVHGSETESTRIAPDLVLVTEFSVKEPLVGQQVAVLYRLRATPPPAAVDIDPQQFSGFWTEIAPLADTGRSRSPDGGASVEFLLRQVIVFPLYAGDLQLPPLRIKVKRNTSVASRADDWDIIGSSSPVLLRVRDLPAVNALQHRWPLVGAVSGTLQEQRISGAPRTILELKGTAHLALFDPLEWLHDRRIQARTIEWESSVQTLDMHGKRVVTLIQRRRWALDPGVKEISLPVFQPESQSFTPLRLTVNP